MIAWLVDAAAIISQKALLKCSYAPYARIMKKICWEESFHILHGRDVILTLMNGTDEQRELVQEALDRWWGPLMQFHGNPIPAEDDPMCIWRIKSQGNEEARQQFLDGYVPQIWELGLDGARPEAAQATTTASGSTPSPTGTSSRRVVTGHGPASAGAARVPQALARRDRLGSRTSCSPRRREVFEVFRQERAGAPFQHAGSVAAPDARFAEVYAREQYGRRGESTALWLVPREAVDEIEDFVDEFDLKYRRVDGYSIKETLKEARERAGSSCSSRSPTTS